MTKIDTLLSRWPLISDQIDEDQLRVILSEFEKVLEKKTPGAVVEFGCYIGTASLFIQRLLESRQEKREYHVYDSFEGLPDKNSQDASPVGEQFKAGELAVSKKQFVREFQKANLRTPTIHKGWFGNLNPADVPERVAFAFLDGDFYESIKDSLTLVLPRMQTGSIMVIDDYAREALPGVAKAVYEAVAPKYLDTLKTIRNLAIIQF